MSSVTISNNKSMVASGLEDVVASTSNICFVDGANGRLIYQGIDINDLIDGHASFEEVIYLLWYGRLPKRTELEEFTKNIATQRKLPEEVSYFLRRMPKNANAMDVLRTTVSLLSMFDPDAGDSSREANIRQATRLVAQIPTIVTTFARLQQGLEPVVADESLSAAASFLYMLKGSQPTDFEVNAFNIALILHADHELNASTFSARVTAGTLSDLYSAITSAIGTLKGPLHGGANEQVIRTLLAIGDIGKVEEWINGELANKRKIMGFGHRVYRTEDPRATHLRQLSKEAGERNNDTKWYEMSQMIEKLVKLKKGLYPNVDFYSASLYYSLGISPHLYTPIFACSRIAGWTAHVLEQYENNRLIRPRAEYTGPVNKVYIPIDER